MGWEERNGNLYYYRKRRIGDKVKSEYVGAGLNAVQAEMAQEQLYDARLAAHDARRADKELDDQIIRLDDCVRTLSRAALSLAGYHSHKGEWRRRSERNNNDGVQ